jgi:hypothetical protein
MTTVHRKKQLNVLASIRRPDETTIGTDEPAIKPATSRLKVAKAFNHDAPSFSLTVMRLKLSK